MRIYSWNVNGIRSATKNGFGEWFKNACPEVLCLQETRAEENSLSDDVRMPEGYFCFWNSSKKKKGTNGTAILSQIEPDAVEYGFGIDEFDDEGRVVQLVFPDWVLNSICFPSGNRGEDRVDFKLRFYDAFLDNCLEWLHRGRHVVTLGDYKACHTELDIACPQDNEEENVFLPVERAWIDKYIAAGFEDTFRALHPDETGAYTWWPGKASVREKNEGFRVDCAFVDSGILPNVTDARIYPQVLGSDHCPISVDLELPFPPISKEDMGISDRGTRKNPVI